MKGVAARGWKQVAEVLKCSTITAKRKARAGLLRISKDGRAVILTEEALEQYAQSLPAKKFDPKKTVGGSR